MSRQHVPGAWYDLGGHIGAAKAVVDAIEYYIPSSNQVDMGASLQSIEDMAAAVSALLSLCRASCDELERAFLALPGEAAPP